MQASLKELLLIFIKNPKKGAVKTRLATTLGDEKALSIYEKLLNHTRSVVQSVHVDKQLWYSDFIPESDNWDHIAPVKKLQERKNLGQRMKYAFKQAFDDGYQNIVIIGSDCAQLQSRHIEKAFNALKSYETVIGPAPDGGYYLLGMNRFLPVLFANKPWGKSGVLQQTIANCEQQGITYKLLEKLNDVDTEKDWNEVKNRF